MTIEAAFFGTLGNDAERKVSKADKPYLRMSVRTGEGDAAVWISVTAFDPQAVDGSDRFVKGARCYVEGKLTPTTWTTQDGVQRHGLSVLSWHCRLAQIGHNKPKRNKAGSTGADRRHQHAATSGAELDDEIPF